MRQSKIKKSLKSKQTFPKWDSNTLCCGLQVCTAPPWSCLSTEGGGIHRHLLPLAKMPTLRREVYHVFFSYLSGQSLLLTLWEKRNQNPSRSVLVIDGVHEKYNTTALRNRIGPQHISSQISTKDATPVHSHPSLFSFIAPLHVFYWTYPILYPNVAHTFYCR